MPPVPFATQSYRHDSLPIAAQRAVNWYAERQPPDAKSQVTSHGSPGITTFATCGAGPIRGFRMLGGLLYVVSGTSLYSIASTGTATEVGIGITGTGIVSISENGNEIQIVNGTNGYLYDTTSGFRAITDTDFNAAHTTTYLDGFFLLAQADSAQFFRSDLLDGSSYDALAFATKESKSGNVRAVVNVKQIAYVLGETAGSELWNNQGAANFPFQRIPGGTIDRGIISSHAHAQEDQTLFMVGEDRMAYKVAGTSLGRISTHAIERTWQKYTSVSDCFGLAYTDNGHKVIVFTFPTEQADLGDTTSWAYDISTGLWHEKLSFDMSGNPLGRWRANCAIEAYGKTFIGDAWSGKVGYLDGTVQTEFGDPMYAKATSPPYHAGDKALFHSDLVLDMETGVGIASGQGSDPQVMLRVSDDGGTTYSPLEEWHSLGAQGRLTQPRWTRLGRTERGGIRVYEVTISDPVKRTIIAAHADMKAGM